CLVLFVRLRRQAGGVYGRDLVSSTARILLATLAMSAVVWGGDRLVEHWLGNSKLGSVVSLASCIPLGAYVFYGVAKALGVAELEMAAAGFSGPFRRLRRMLPF
ncbi:MAG: hypothetical protein JNN08_26940, partial [Bryobacterales bacterium]|nr:hypothetical protein [Bryobacterales bacterium]